MRAHTPPETADSTTAHPHLSETPILSDAAISAAVHEATASLMEMEPKPATKKEDEQDPFAHFYTEHGDGMGG